MLAEVHVRINGEVLQWAIKRFDTIGLDFSTVSGFTPEQLQKWKTEESEPSYSQAISLCSKLGIPFGYLFLSAKPKKDLALPDLRTRTLHGTLRTPSIGMIAVVDDAIRKQHWYSDFLRDHGAKEKKFVGSFSMNDGSSKIAAAIRQHIGIDEQMRAESSPAYAAFMTEVVRRTEAAGIMVLRSGTVCGNTHKALNVEEFRGFALPDAFAPMIFINSRDAMAAQLFTWAHEIAHIWINKGGVSLLDLSKKTQDQSNAIEIKCNEIAAEVLVPTASFTYNWDSTLPPALNVNILRTRYRVSELVVLRKAYDSGLLGQQEFYDGLKRYYEIPLATKLKKENQKSGGDFYNNLYARNSSTVTATVAESYSSGYVPATEACRLLGVRQKVLIKLIAAT